MRESKRKRKVGGEEEGKKEGKKEEARVRDRMFSIKNCNAGILKRGTPVPSLHCRYLSESDLGFEELENWSMAISHELGLWV